MNKLQVFFQAILKFDIISITFGHVLCQNELHFCCLQRKSKVHKERVLVDSSSVHTTDFIPVFECDDNNRYQSTLHEILCKQLYNKGAAILDHFLRRLGAR